MIHKSLYKALQTRITELEALTETLKNEAQIHAMEAKTANATINEINQFISGATGEPANWHGAQPVKDFVNDLKVQLAAVRKDAERLDFMLENSAFMVAHHGNRWQCQTQDLDENYIVLSGIGCSYLTEREAIDAAIKGEQA